MFDGLLNPDGHAPGRADHALPVAAVALSSAVAASLVILLGLMVLAPATDDRADQATVLPC